MNKIYFLKNFEEKFKGKIEDSALVYPLDYKSLYILKNNKIKFDLIDNFLNDNDRKELFQTCRNIWNEFTNISKKELDALLVLAKKEKQKDLEERQKKAFDDPFMLAEKRAWKKRQDEILIEQDRIECGDYNRKKVKKEYY